MNAANTIVAFDAVIRPLMQRVSRQHPNVAFEYEGDNARAQISRRFRNYLATLQHPHTPFAGHPINAPNGRAPNSPDMCVIEYVFAQWQEEVYRQNPQSVAELIRVADREWANISQAQIQATYRHMLPVMEWIEAHNGVQNGYHT